MEKIKTNSKLPLLSLSNQYTYLRQKQNQKNNALRDLSIELKSYDRERLPSINRKKERSQVHRVENLIIKLEKALKDKNQNNRNMYPHSQQRSSPKIIPYYFPLSMPIQQIHIIRTPAQPQNPTSTAIKSPSPSPSPQPQPQPQPQPPQQQAQQQRKPKQIHQFAKKSPLNKFRICGYAIYFSIYIKHFSRKYTELRRNWFNERYALNNGKIINDSSSKIQKLLYEVDIYKMIESAKKKVKETDLEELNITRASKAKGKGSDSVLIMIHFITLLIEYAHQLMSNKQFLKEHHEVFSVGVLTQNFMMTNLYLPQEAALLHIHEQGYIQINEETQIILLMIKIVIKIIVYNFLLTLKSSRHWNAKQEKSHGLDDSDMEEIWKITRNSGIFLTIVCQEIYDRSYMQKPYFSRNFNQMAPKFNIMAAKSLQQIHKAPSPEQANTLTPQSSKLIVNLQGYNDIQTMISLSQTLQKFKDKIKLKLIDFLTSVYTTLKYQEVVVYDFVRSLTLDQEFVIFKGMKEEALRKQKLKKNNKNKKNKNKKNKKKNKNRNRNGNGNGNGDGEDGEDGEGDGDGESQNQDSRNNSENGSDDDDEDGDGEDDDEDGEDGENGDEDGQDGEGKKKKKKKKYRYKHEQAFFDHKFHGHKKLQKLKKKMKKKKP